MMRVYPLVRAQIETLLSAVDPLFDPSRLCLGTKHHAAYIACEASSGNAADASAALLVSKLASRCTFATLTAASCYLNFNLSASYLGGFMAAFMHVLPPLSRRPDSTEQELFSPVLYTALRLHAVAGKDSRCFCPSDDAAKDALFALYGLAEALGSPNLKSKAEKAAVLLLLLFQNIPNTERKERLHALCSIAALGSRALFYAHSQLRDAHTQLRAAHIKLRLVDKGEPIAIQ